VYPLEKKRLVLWHKWTHLNKYSRGEQGKVKFPSDSWLGFPAAPTISMSFEFTYPEQKMQLKVKKKTLKHLFKRSS
jgi:hypothetical protein